MHSPDNPDRDFTVELGDTLDRLSDLFDASIELPELQRHSWLKAHVTDANQGAAVLRLPADDNGTGLLDSPRPSTQRASLQRRYAQAHRAAKTDQRISRDP